MINLFSANQKYFISKSFKKERLAKKQKGKAEGKMGILYS